MLRLEDVRTKQQEERYAENAAKCKGSTQPCAICGKPVPRPQHYAHMHEGGAAIVTEEEAATLDPAGDLGAYPVGPDCARLPALKPYLHND